MGQIAEFVAVVSCALFTGAAVYKSVGWHSTSGNEEALVILHGSGVANVEGRPDVPLTERMLAYIPRETRHNVTNTGKQDLEYVWVVAPTNAAKP